MENQASSNARRVEVRPAGLPGSRAATASLQYSTTTVPSASVAGDAGADCRAAACAWGTLTRSIEVAT